MVGEWPRTCHSQDTNDWGVHACSNSNLACTIEFIAIGPSDMIDLFRHMHDT